MKTIKLGKKVWHRQMPLSGVVIQVFKGGAVRVLTERGKQTWRAGKYRQG